MLISRGSLNLSLKSHPAPMGSELTSAGSADTDALTSTMVPLKGANTSEADETNAKGAKVHEVTVYERQ